MSQALASLRDRHTFVANELEKARGRLAAIIPSSTGLMPSRAIAVTLDALTRNPDLLECEPRSIVRSVLHASEIGLELGSPLGEAFIVPFKGKATMMVGYRGFVKLIRGAPRVTIVKGVLVREADDFEIDEGANVLHHRIGKGTVQNRGEITHAYSRVYYDNGSSQFEVMDRSELDVIKAAALSRSRRFTPWKEAAHVGEMYKKCPLRRQAKWLDLSPLGRRGSELDDLEMMRRGELGAIPREGFTAQRAEELKSMLDAQDKAVEVLEVEGELVEEGGVPS